MNLNLNSNLDLNLNFSGRQVLALFSRPVLPWVPGGRIFILLFLLLILILLWTLPAGAAEVGSPGPTFRWSATSNRIYVENGGSATLSDIKAAVPNAPIDLVDPAHGVWLLRADLWIQGGSTLVLHGTAIGGDVNEFRLQSNNTSDPGSIVTVVADWGAIDIKSTRVTSWDTAAGGPDTEYRDFGRACIRARSSLADDGVTPLESRMDIEDSDVGYLGYEAPESFGLSWKVTGVHPDPALSIFDFVNVYGDVIHSHIHDNYFGVYTFGAYGSQFLNNEVDHNAGYGLDPHDDSDFLLIEGNNVHHNGLANLHNAAGGPRGLHGIIASRRCDHLTIRNNVSWANAGNGIMLHRHCNDCLIEGNHSYRNGDSGIAVFDDDRAVIRDNLIESNTNAGIRFSVGSADNQVLNNEIAFSGTNGIYFFAGTDLPEPDDDDPTLSARPRRNVIANNLVHDCRAEGLKISNADGNQVLGNVFQNNSPLIRFQEGVSNVLDGNQIPGDVTLRSVGTSLVAATTTVRNQASLRVDLNDLSTVTFEDDHGAVFDPLEADLPVVIGPGGSMLSLTSPEPDLQLTVVMRDFKVTTPGEALITPTLWNLVGDLSKQWFTQSSTPGQAIAYTVGDLAPNSSYTVLKDDNGQGQGRPGRGRKKRRSEERRVGKECRSRWSPYH